MKADAAPLVVDNHGHIGKFEAMDIVDGYDPDLYLGGSHRWWRSSPARRCQGLPAGTLGPGIPPEMERPPGCPGGRRVCRF